MRHGQIEHDEDCPTKSHTAFFNEFVCERSNSRFDQLIPEVCPAFPKLWDSWHDEFNMNKWAKMPMKSTFKIDLTNFAKDPVPLQPKST